MPEFQIVRCCECNMFQVKQESKNSRWDCKICGKMQSVQLILASSSKPNEQRHIVQDMNMAYGVQQQQKSTLHRENVLVTPIPSNIPVSEEHHTWDQFLDDTKNKRKKKLSDIDLEPHEFTSLPVNEIKKRRTDELQPGRLQSSVSSGASSTQSANNPWEEFL